MTTQETRPQTATELTRTLDGIALPVAGIWQIDAGHTSVEFVGRHLMLSKVRGRFTDVQGTVTVGETAATSELAVTIAMASVNSGNEERDADLRSPDFFDVTNHPTATFTGARVEWQGTRGTVTGDLEMMGVRREVRLDVEFLGASVDPWGGRRAVFSASTELDREAWGLDWNMPLGGSGLLVSKRIQLEIETELVLED